MNQQRLYELMLEAGYAAPNFAPRARALAKLIVEEMETVTSLAVAWMDVDGDIINARTKNHALPETERYTIPLYR